MKNALKSGAVLCAQILLTGTASAQTGDGVIAQGRVLIEGNCGRCHAIGQDDKSPHAVAPPFRIVVTRYPPRSLAEALAEGIVSGHPDMPEFVFKTPEIEAIIAYLDSLKRAGDDPPQKD
jgi:mono/diheme cytochrome c family protein